MPCGELLNLLRVMHAGCGEKAAQYATDTCGVDALKKAALCPALSARSGTRHLVASHLLAHAALLSSDDDARDCLRVRD
jgi:hypothetical protein